VSRLKRRAARGEKYQAVATRLVDWFQQNQRDLPFRRTTDPYAILVSEIMLQQTQVTTVIPYYERFLHRYPTVAALAAADEQEVLTYWAGLGYYRRARNLHAAAKAIEAEFGGTFPRELTDILRLPGVGRYTAGAVASFAYNDPHPILEANSARVLARIFAVRENIKSAPAQAKLWTHASNLIPLGKARLLNYAMMELGALICTPSNPQCTKCPVSTHCTAFAKNLQHKLPVLPEKREKIAKAYSCVVLRSGDEYLLRRIPEGEWHAGLYEFPKVEHEVAASAPERQLAAESLVKNLGQNAGALHESCCIRYTVTHHTIALHVFHASATRTAATLPAGYQWAAEEKLTQLPMGAPQKRIVKLLRRECDLVGLL
jgi:A/G-specific adenine glycosylase